MRRIGKGRDAVFLVSLLACVVIVHTTTSLVVHAADTANGGRETKASRACRSYEVPRKKHRTPIADIRIKEGFDVLEMACLVNVTHKNVGNIEMELSTYTTNAQDMEHGSRKVSLKHFGESAGGRNLRNSVFADFGEDLVMEEETAPYTGIWRPAEPFKRLVRGWGRRTSIGGSKGVWTLQVNARKNDVGDMVHMFSEDLPVLEGWVLYLCGEGESLMSTPDIYTAWRRQQGLEEDGGEEEDYVVTAFSGRSQPGNYAAAAQSDWVSEVRERMQRVRRGIFRWVIGSMVWNSWKNFIFHAKDSGATIHRIYHAQEQHKGGANIHIAQERDHFYKKSVTEHFDYQTHN